MPGSPDPRLPDPRLNAYRPDLADARLRGIVEALRYSDGGAAQAILPVAPLAAKPDPDAEMTSEVLFGETVRVFEERAGWAWLQADLDGYVGYAPSAAFSPVVHPATHRVAVTATLVQAEPITRAPPLMDLSLGARVTVIGAAGAYSALQGGGFVPTRHLMAIGEKVRDSVAVAEALVGAPYLWGGRSRIGIDCSGLVQIALQAAGRAAPRDSDQQRELGHSIPITADLSGLDRGDLVFWPGHVGMMVDADRVIHANAHHMAVVVEPLVDAAARSQAAGNAVLAIRRLG